MVDIRLQFSSIEGTKDRPQIYEKKATFYEAEIKVDAIISYPWLLENKLGVIPHRRAVVMEDLEIVLLTGLYYSLPNKEKKWWKISPGEGGSTRCKLREKKGKKKSAPPSGGGGSDEPLVENLAVGPTLEGESHRWKIQNIQTVNVQKTLKFHEKSGKKLKKMSVGSFCRKSEKMLCLNEINEVYLYHLS